jgi:hypothetical protein
MCHLVIDKYSNSIEYLNQSLNRAAIKTSLNEMVLDLISSIKEDAPPLPDMTDPSTFKFYFIRYNKEYK